jgi:hypothetical protein
LVFRIQSSGNLALQNTTYGELGGKTGKAATSVENILVIHCMKSKILLLNIASNHKNNIYFNVLTGSIKETIILSSPTLPIHPVVFLPRRARITHRAHYGCGGRFP